MIEKTVLGIGLGPKKEKAIREFVRSCRMRYRSVQPSEYEKTLGSLAAIAGIPARMAPGHGGRPANPVGKSAALPPVQEMLVFSGFSQEELEEFLSLYRTAGLEPVTLKAMVTMYNIFWTPAMLFAEISEEHRRMNAPKEFKEPDA